MNFDQMKSANISIILLCASLFFLRCNDKNTTSSNLECMNSQSIDSAFSRLAGRKIYFGHQSVGYNIINGLKLLENSSNNKLQIIEGLPDSNSIPAFYHTSIGSNCNPISKIDDFVAKMESHGSAGIDIAFFKFCYIDFSGNTDVDKLFEYYSKSMMRLKQEFPSTKFIYCTVPLFAAESKLKTLIKIILGRGDNNKAENISRNKFNQLLLEHYGKSEAIFDIAKYESNNYQTYFIKDGSKIFTLYPGFTSDGGHLNEVGSKVVATGLLELLVNLE